MKWFQKLGKFFGGALAIFKDFVEEAFGFEDKITMAELKPVAIALAKVYMEKEYSGDQIEAELLKVLNQKATEKKLKADTNLLRTIALMAARVAIKKYGG